MSCGRRGPGSWPRPDAARREIERNLHDGAQQHLVALAVNVRLARELAETDSEASLELLDQLGLDLQDAVQELRALAHGIYPPLLIDRGLEEALRAAAGRAALPDRGGGRRTSAATRPRPRRPPTSAAWRRSRTPASTPARGRGDRPGVAGRRPAVLRGGRHRRRLRHERGRRQGGGVREHERPGRRGWRTAERRVSPRPGRHISGRCRSPSRRSRRSPSPRRSEPGFPAAPHDTRDAICSDDCATLPW